MIRVQDQQPIVDKPTLHVNYKIFVDYCISIQNLLCASVPDTLHFDTDPAPWIRTMAFCQWLSRCQKICFFLIFFAYFLL